MELKVKIKEVKLLRTNGTDLINIILDENSSFPIMKYDTVIKIECQQGYGEEYCKETLGLIPKIIDVC
jgi:hypothetical protein